MKIQSVRRLWSAAVLLGAIAVTAAACGTSDVPEVSENPVDSASATASIPAQPASQAPATLAAPRGAQPTPGTTGERAADPTLPATRAQPDPTARVENIGPTDTATTDTPTPETTKAEAEPTAKPAPTTVALSNDWEKELRTSAISTAGWETDFSKRSVPYAEIFSGGVPRDGIPPIDDPKFVTVEDADDWLEDLEPVISLEIEGEARAYPLQILTWHEIVNDTVAEIPVTATFCPLCNSAIVFDRRLNGEVYDFGVSGNLRNSDLIMWDRQTESWWQQLTGEAIVGELTGQRLDILPATIVAWQDFQSTYPEAKVLSRDTGHRRNYGNNPYVGYDEVGRPPFLFFGENDERLGPTERVAALTAGDKALAFPFSFLEEERVVQHQVGDQNLVVFFRPGARSALDSFSIAGSRKVGATGIFLRELNGETLNFGADGDDFVDEETGTRWNIFGQGVSGPLAGEQLTPVVHANHFWFAWAAFRPDTEVVR